MSSPPVSGLYGLDNPHRSLPAGAAYGGDPNEPHAAELSPSGRGAPAWLMLVLGIGLGAGGMYAYTLRAAAPASDPAACDDRCGESTVCDDGKCRTAATKTAKSSRDKRKRRRKRNRARRASKSGNYPQAEYDDVQLPPFVPVNDRNVPRFDRKRVQTISMQDGDERISDHEIRQEMRKLEPAFNRCLERAAQYSADELGSGSFDFEFGVRSNGKVNGVNVRAPKHLRVFGTIPCMRKALFEHRFRAFDGPTMGVDYGFSVD